jgi:ribonuclease HII
LRPQAACYFPAGVTVTGIHDSKKLNEAEREELYEMLVNHPDIDYAISILVRKSVRLGKRNPDTLYVPFLTSFNT